MVVGPSKGARTFAAADGAATLRSPALVSGHDFSHTEIATKSFRDSAPAENFVVASISCEKHDHYSRKCQTSTATPAKPAGSPGLNSCHRYHNGESGPAHAQGL